MHGLPFISKEVVPGPPTPTPGYQNSQMLNSLI